MNKEKNIDEYIKDVWGNDTKRFIINSHVEAYIHRLERENKDFQKKAEQYKSDYEKEKYLVDKLTRQLTDEYKNTEKQKERGEHYKHLYSEVKKQKDDVVEYIKNNDLIYNHDCGEMFRVLLRMLGEIDDNNFKQWRRLYNNKQNKLC